MSLKAISREVTTSSQAERQDIEQTSSTTQAANTTAKQETVARSTPAFTETGTVADDATVTTRKTTDAGFIISFSIPLRGGLYNDASANPPL